MIPRIQKIGFGDIRINNEVFGKEDFLLFWDSVEPLEKSHRPSVEEFEKILLKEPDTVIYGTGFRSLGKISDEIISAAKKENVELLILPTPEALKKFQELVRNGRRAAARIHTTC